MSRILCLTRYQALGASSRLRFLQYLPALRAAGMTVEVAPLFDDSYLLRKYSGRSVAFEVVSALARRTLALLRAGSCNLLWVEKEVLPWVPSLFELALLPPRVPVVVDYDDAVFHSYDLHRNTLVRRLLAHKIDHFMARAALVVAGNPYLAARASAAGARRIELLPTVIDLSRYGAQPVAPHPLTIGWIGSPSTVPYLREIASVLVEAVSPVGGRVIAVGAHPAQLADLPIEVQPWSEDSEVEAIRQFDIGVMPLPDDPWSRGKCGYKLIQYMGCGLPVIASPVGINGEIVDDGRNGLLAQGHDAWRCALARLVADPALRQSMGTAALQKVTDKYQLAVTAPRLTQLLRSTLGGLSPLDHVRNADHD